MIEGALPNGKRGQVLAWAIAALVAFLVWAVFVSPILESYSSRGRRLDSMQQRLAHEVALVEMLPTLRARIQLVPAPRAVELLSGSSDAIAGASLQERAQAIASAAHARLRSIETLPGMQVGVYRLIAVRLELSGQLHVIVDVLRSIEEGTPEMMIDDTRIKVAALSPINDRNSLDCEFTVYSFRKQDVELSRK